MTDANDPAYSAADTIHPLTTERCTPLQMGMTKREVFAMAAMQGFLASYAGMPTVPKSDHIAQRSIELADALIEALNK